MEENKPKNTKLIAIIASVLVAVVVLIVVLIIVLGKKGPGSIVGRWTMSDGSGFAYNFKKDGNGTYGECTAEMSEKECDEEAYYTFAYKTTKADVDGDGKEDDAIEFLYDGFTTPMTLKYRFDGDKLLIADSYGKDVSYNRVEKK